MASTVLFGTDVKFKLTVDAEDFNIETDNIGIDLYINGVLTESFTKEHLVKEGDDYYFCIETKDYSVGQYDVVTTIDIPDTAFPDNIRTEIYRNNLVFVKPIQ